MLINIETLNNKPQYPALLIIEHKYQNFLIRLKSQSATELQYIAIKRVIFVAG
jgi:hypothetical protein